ncbi:MAG TPA: hypothetical protein GXX34_11105 [Clostridia bacterium]|nr:hypothetical protein [Clostridia bacterium]
MFGLNCREFILELVERWRKPAGYLDLPEETLKDLRVLEEIKSEWYIAKRYFNEVTEPALVDYAIYNMEAAEKRLVHFISLMRDKYPAGIWQLEIDRLDGAEVEQEEQASVTEG